jgi:hypothetical protein
MLLGDAALVASENFTGSVNICKRKRTNLESKKVSFLATVIENVEDGNHPTAMEEL